MRFSSRDGTASAHAAARRRKRTYGCQLVIGSCWFALLALAGLNYVRELSLVGPYSKDLLIWSVAGMGAWWAFFGPRNDDVRARYRLRRKRENAWLRQHKLTGGQE